MHFLYRCSKIFTERGLNFTWSFFKVICTQSMNIVFVSSIIRNKLCIIYVFFYYFFQKSLTENYFPIAAKNLTTRGPLYTCLVLIAAINLAIRGPLYTCLVYYVRCLSNRNLSDGFIKEADIFHKMIISFWLYMNMIKILFWKRHQRLWIFCFHMHQSLFPDIISWVERTLIFVLSNLQLTCLRWLCHVAEPA